MIFAPVTALVGVAWMAAPAAWLLPVMVGAVALLILGLAGERGLLRRGRGAPRGARVVAWTVAVVGLSLLVLRPQARGSGSLNGASLWTDAVAPSAALGSAGPAYLVAPAGAGTVSAPPGAEILPDARSLWRKHPGLARVNVNGHGLDSFDWEGFGGTVSFSPPPLPRGVVRALWSREVALGERLRVSGAVALGGVPGGTAGSSVGTVAEVKLVLEGPGGVDDAVVLQRGPAPSPFTLTALPRAAGQALYVLRALDTSGSELFRETVDVVVDSPHLPAVLVLESAPRFETRFLKDWLAGAGARVAVRTTISRDRRRTETPGVAGSEDSDKAAASDSAVLDPALLRAFDAVIADPAALEALRPQERAALRGAIDAGCGLLVALPRGVPPPASIFTPAPPAVKPIPELDLLAARPTWSGAPSLPALDVEARELGPCATCTPIVSDPSGRILATAAPFGRAMVAWTVLHDTYRYVLEGNGAAHRALWSRLVSSVARPTAAVEGRWLRPSGPLVVDRPLEITLMTGEPAPTADLFDGSDASEPQRVALRQDALEAERWTATVWPRRTGWQSVRASSGATLAFAVAPVGDWTAWQAAERQEATARRAAATQRAPAVDHGAEPWQALPRWPFFALLFAGLGWLWIDERLRG